MKWINQPSKIDDFEGFVYVIQHKETCKYYIGKKSFWKSIRRKPLKGHKRVRLDRIESDWKNYWGSSKKFVEYVKKEGKNKFNRHILCLCKTKSEMSYRELLKQIDYNVLNDPYSYNGIINVRLNKTK